ncbi:carbamate kinase [Enterococcus sp. LJL99]
MKKRVVIALGGNAILQPGQEGTYENQRKNIDDSCEKIASLIHAGHELVVTHGNGPQVGQILQQNEIASEEIPMQPLPVCAAESQGFIGYMIEESLTNELTRLAVDKEVTAILTMTEVEKDPEVFNNPTKPIGTFFTKEEAEALTEEKGWFMGEDAGRGYRRFVPSPIPKSIIGVKAIKNLLSSETIVVASGGGGIPVARDENNNLSGVAAVIDKDLSALRLSEEIEADVLMILTDVSNVYIHYGTPNQAKLETLSVETAQKYYDEGHFSEGSMGPKMKAAIQFASQGNTAIICSIDQALEALNGQAGTRVVG